MIRRCGGLFRIGFTATMLMVALVAQNVLAQDIARISVQEAHAKVTNGKALLVCSYSDRYCSDMLLKGAILKSELESRVSNLPKNSEIIFYCA